MDKMQPTVTPKVEYVVYIPIYNCTDYAVI